MWSKQVQEEPEEKLEGIRAAVANLIWNTKPLNSNTTKERRALKHLEHNEDIVILQADKRNATVVLNTTRYISKANSILDKAAFQKLERGITNMNETRMNNKIKRLLRRKEIDERL